MRIAGALLGIVMLCVAAPGSSQVRPQPGTGDARIQLVDYRTDQVVLIEAAAGYQVSVELASDEQVQSVAVGDSAAWQVTANRAGNRLFLKPVQASGATNMTVVTNVRTYAFDLASQSAPMVGAPYTVRFRYPASAVAAAGPDQAPSAMIGHYRVRGSSSLIPARIGDDGVRTYIDWPAKAGLPAVYVLGIDGRESLANGNMRDGLFVIDGIAQHLVFRIDKRKARADRMLSEGS